MPCDVQRVALEDVLPLRELYRRQMNGQILHDSWPARGWADPYLLRVDGRIAGYGLLGGAAGHPRDCIIEFHLLPAFRTAALPLFRQLAEAGQATTIRAQTNDRWMTLMLYDCAAQIESDTILFEDGFTTDFGVAGATFRWIDQAEEGRIFAHTVEPVGAWGIEVGGEIAATGGLLFHYNPPYGDIHMEVAEPFRRRGIGSFLVQELKRTCYEMGKVPAARCRASNIASRATLQKAGLLPCARLLTGTLARSTETHAGAQASGR